MTLAMWDHRVMTQPFLDILGHMVMTEHLDIPVAEVMTVSDTQVHRAMMVLDTQVAKVI